MATTDGTDLLALRLSAVPFHDVTREETMGGRSGLADADAEMEGEDEETGGGGERLTAERWVSHIIDISFLGPLRPPPPHIPLPPGTFSTTIPQLLNPHNPPTIPLIILPDTLVVGQLPPINPSSPPSPPIQWLISGELCIMSDELVIVAQSLYAQGTGGGGAERSRVSVTGYINRIVAGWGLGREYGGGCEQERGREGEETLEAAMRVADDEEAWQSAEEVCSRTEVYLADLQWLDLSVHLGRKSPRLPARWFYAHSELVSFKCRPQKLNLDHRQRPIHYASPLPLNGQLIAIQPPSDQHPLTFFIQL